MILALTIPGVPPQKNARDRVVAQRLRGGKTKLMRYPTAEFKRLVDVVALVWDRERARRGLHRIEAGRLALTLRAFWDRERHIDFDTALGDVDAPLSCVLDALQRAGVLDDDVRIVELVATKHVDKAYPRVEVEIREAPPEGQLPLAMPPPDMRDDF